MDNALKIDTPKIGRVCGLQINFPDGLDTFRKYKKEAVTVGAKYVDVEVIIGKEAKEFTFRDFLNRLGFE